MQRVIAHMTMSLDGYIATDTDDVGVLFDWYDAGDTEVASGNPNIKFHLDDAGARMMRALMADTGALICGRRLFDITSGWGDMHPLGVPVVVVTHQAPSDADRWPRTTFVSDLAQAVETAKGLAKQRDVAIASADVGGQALDLKLLDEVAVSLVPVLMGTGKAYFGTLTHGPIMLNDPTITPGKRATHLRYQVQR